MTKITTRNSFEIKCKQVLSLYSQISKTRNEANLKKMTTKNNLVEKVIHDTLAKINSFAKPDNPRYRQIVKELLIEGMVKLLEPTCLVRVRRSDVPFVKGILKDCEKEFGALMKKETGNEFNCQLHMDESEFIPNER